MVSAKGVITGNVSAKEIITGTLNVGTEYIDPITQKKEITPNNAIQEVVPDNGYTALSKVIVDKIPDDYIIPTGSIDIDSNGTYDIKDKTTANVNIPEKILGTKKITKNGLYLANDDNLDGYSEVEVETSGEDISEYFQEKISSTYYQSGVLDAIKKIPKFKFSGDSCRALFQGLTRVQEIDLELIDTSNSTIFEYAFSCCRLAPTLLNANKLDTSKVTRFGSSFSTWNGKANFVLDLSWLNTDSATSLFSMFNNNFASEINLSNADFSKVADLNNMFAGASSLKNLILKENHNLGKGFLTTQSANYYNYKFDLSSCKNLTHDSLMNVINGLYDIARAGVQPQQLVLGSTNLAKLTEEEIAIATNKGWTVS